MLPSFGGLKRLYLRYFAKPAHDRVLLRLVHRQRISRIAQLGIGDLTRTLRLLAAAQADNGGLSLDLVGIDKFEMRSEVDGPGLSLKEAHRVLASHGIKARLLPGEPLTVLAASANSLGGNDLLLISADQDRESLARAWFYVPRMLSATGVVFIEEPHDGAGEFCWRQVSQEELTRLAAKPRTRRAA